MRCDICTLVFHGDHCPNGRRNDHDRDPEQHAAARAHIERYRAGMAVVTR